MSRGKSKKIERLHQLVEQSKSVSDRQLAEIVAGYQNGLDMDALRHYMEQQTQKDRQLQPSASGTQERPNPFIPLSLEQLSGLSASDNSLVAMGAKLELARRESFSVR